jgi:hypothetical protein
MRVLLAILALAASGCAFSNVPITLPQTSLNLSGDPGGDRPIAVVVPFGDRRPHKQRCGMQKNGYNMDTADAVCDEQPARWIAELLARELAEAGFRVVRSSEDAAAVKVEGRLVQLFVEPVIGVWTGSLEADIGVHLRVTSLNGLDARRRFFAKGIRGGQLFSVEGAYQMALERATDDIAQQMVASVVELLDQYPEALSHED